MQAWGLLRVAEAHAQSHMASPSTTMEEMYHLSRTDATALSPTLIRPAVDLALRFPHVSTLDAICHYVHISLMAQGRIRCTDGPCEVLDMRKMRATPRGQGAVSPAPNDTACHARRASVLDRGGCIAGRMTDLLQNTSGRYKPKCPSDRQK